MKKIVTTTPIFNPGARTLDTGILNFDIRRLYAVINQTKGAIIYATGVAGLGLASLAGNVLTLQVDTTSHAATDLLQIIYDDSEDTDLTAALYELIDRLAFLANVRGTSADLRVTALGGTITTVSSVSNMGSIGGYTANQHIPATQNVAAQANINNLIIS